MTIQRKGPQSRGAPAGRRLRTIEALESRTLMTANLASAATGSSAWHNAVNKFDVNADNRVSTMDAMLIINDLRTHGSHAVPFQVAPLSVTAFAATAAASTSSGLRYFDVNGDGKVSTIDAMLVINRIKALAVTPDVKFTLSLTDTSGNPLPANTIAQGTDFMLRGFVEDARTADPDPSTPQDDRGVASAYFSAMYDNTTAVSLTAPPATVQHYSPYTDLPSGDASTVGSVLNAGGTDFNLVSSPGPGPMLVWSVVLHANAGGTVNFSEAADSSGDPNHDVIFFAPPQTASNPDYSSTAQLTIIGGPPPAPTLSISNVSLPEGNSGTTAFTFDVTLSSASATPVTVDYATQDGTATSPSDYAAGFGTLTFAAGQTSQQVTVLVNGDTLPEADETFSVHLSNAVGATLPVNPDGTGTILNDDTGPIVGVTNVALPEGNSGTTPFTFVVSLSAASATPITVNYAAVSGGALGTATAGVDFVAASGSVTFAAGEVSKNITVLVNGDTTPEPDETFSLVISDAGNNTLAQGTGTILNDDGAAGAASIAGFVYVDSNNNGKKDSNELGIANVTVTATQVGSGVTQTTQTDSAGHYAFQNLAAGTYNLVETQPGFFVDGLDTPGAPTPTGAAVNDQFNGIVLGANTAAVDFNFGELGLRSQFLGLFMNRRVFFGSADLTAPQFGAPLSSDHIDLTQGAVFLSFDAGFQSLRTFTATFDPTLGDASLTLYDNNLRVLATSPAGQSPAVIQWSGVAGQPYFLRISGSNPDVSLSLTDAPLIVNPAPPSGGFVRGFQ